MHVPRCWCIGHASSSAMLLVPDSMESQKFTNGYLGIHTDGLKCLNPWQMVAKIIE